MDTKPVLITMSLAAVVFLSCSASAAEVSASEIQENLNLIWIFVSAALVFLMQAGFTALETGLVRAKNAINVALKNISDFVVAIMGFWRYREVSER